MPGSIGLMVRSILYGAYMILYGLCMYILFTQKRGRYWVHSILITAIYVAATIHFALTYAIHSIEVFSSDMLLRIDQMELTISVLTIIANCMTDILLLWRCYLVWDRKLKVVIVPLLFCLGSNAFGFVQAVFFSSPQSLNPQFMGPQSLTFTFAIFGVCAVTSNLLLTALLAGRICFIVNRVTRYLPPSSRKMYKTIISATLESGLLYPMVMLIYALFDIFWWRQPSSAVDWSLLAGISIIIFNSLINVMGIASVLIIVRISLGIAINDEKTFKETILRNQGPSLNGPGAQTVIDIRREPCGCEQSRRETGGSDLELQDEERKGL
ncbi:hypothetical protein PM082_022024 [Marasmius tenuissimus]|nr:hypothetical protein PM082_022024 [Marasmius tenuissimus]